MKLRRKIDWLNIVSLFVIVYCFFGIVYLEPNPLEWKFSGMIISILVLGTGLKSQIYADY